MFRERDIMPTMFFYQKQGNVSIKNQSATSSHPTHLHIVEVKRVEMCRGAQNKTIFAVVVSVYT